MPRRTRVHIDGLPLHIVQRGHNRAACFFDNRDRFAYLGWLSEALERERCRLHAYGVIKGVRNLISRGRIHAHRMDAWGVRQESHSGDWFIRC